MSSRLLLPLAFIRTGWLLIPVLALPMRVSAQSANLTVNAVQTVRTVDQRHFGANAVVWDSQTAAAQTVSLMQSAGLGIFRIPGGSAADAYDWSTNQSYASAGVLNTTFRWSAGFDKFSQLITGANAQAFVTVNYGSGTPEQAAAWVAYANSSSTTPPNVTIGVDTYGTDWKTAGYWSNLRASTPLATDDGRNFLRLGRTSPFGLKYWEIGNECYGSWETDFHTVAPQAQWDPVTYATVGASFIAKMKAVDPTIKIGAVSEVSEDALDSRSPIHIVTNPVTNATHHGWTPVMLTTFRNLGVTPDFLIYHRYEQAPGGENDALLLMAPENGASQAGQGWAADAAGLRTQLNNYLGTAVAAHIELDITEDNSVYTNPGKQSTSLVNGLYLADSVANVLQTEFNALVWWDLRNGEDNTQNNSSALYGWRLYGDYGILATPAGQPWGDPSYFDGYPAYYTMKLMSHFARGGDAVVHAASDNTLLPVYAALRADGSLSLLVINKSSTATSTANVSITGFVPLATAGIAVYSYGIPQDTAAQTGTGSPDIATSMIATPQFVVNGGTRSITTTASFGPYSATVLSFQPAPLSSPVISTQPVNQTPTSGQSVVFSVTASSNPLPTYQWQVEARGTGTWTNLSDNSTYSGSGTASLTVNSSALLDGNSFQCMITNSIGTVTTTPVTLVVETPLAVATLAGQAGTSGHADGTRSGAQFNSPTDIAVDGSGNIYAADTDNDTVRKITPDGVVTTIAGQSGVSGSNDGTGSALFNHPAGIAVDGSGNAYVADTTNNTIRKLVIASGTVSTLAGQAGVTGSTNGTGTAARFNGPSGIIADATGNLYVADTLNHTVRKVTGAGVVTTIAGTAGTSGFTDATSTAARFHGPQGLALDTLGNLFVADTNNNAIRMIATANGVVSTVAGQAGIAGSIDGAVSQAQFHFPSGVAVDAGGNLYIADTDNHILRKIAPSSPSVGSNAISLATGKVSTLAGQAGSSGSVDGIGAAARLNFPTGVAVYASLSAQAVPVAGSSSVVYIADTTNSTIRLAVVPAAPAIMSQPQSLTVTVGDTATLTVLAAGSPAPTYQWLFNGSAISGATSSTLALSNAQFANGGNYTVTIRNIVGTVTSNQATLTVNPASTPPSGGGSSSGGGGGGGGAPSVWFCGMLSLLALARRMFRRK